MAKSKQPTQQDAIRAQGLLFIGTNGAHLTGLPARDIPPTEAARLNQKDIDRALASGLYTIHDGGQTL